MWYTVIFAIVIALFTTPTLAQEGCRTEDMVARWETPGHPLNVATTSTSSRCILESFGKKNLTLFSYRSISSETSNAAATL